MPTSAPVFEGATSGSDTATFELTIPSVPAATDNLYILVLSFKETSGGFINAVTGLGLTWTSRWTATQGDHKVAIYTAYGSGSGGDITVQIFDGAFASIVGTVLRYSSVETLLEVYGVVTATGSDDTATATIEARVKKSTVLGMYTYSGSGVTHSTTSGFTARSTQAAGAGADTVNQKLEDKANTAAVGNVAVGGSSDLSAAADWILVTIEIIPTGSGATTEKVFDFTAAQNWQAGSGALGPGPECSGSGVWVGPEATFSAPDNWYRSQLVVEYTRKIKGAIVRATVGNSPDAEYGGVFNDLTVGKFYVADDLAGPWTQAGTDASFSAACNEQAKSIPSQLDNKYLRIVIDAKVSPGNYASDLQGRLARVEITDFIDYTEANEETGPPAASALQIYSGVNGLTYRSDLPFDTINNPACVAVRDDGSVFVGAAAAGGGGELVVKLVAADDYATSTDLTDSLADPVNGLVTL